MSVFTNPAGRAPEQAGAYTTAILELLGDERVGVHAERGEESVAHMMRLYAGHDLLHLNQIARIRARVTGR